MFANLAKSLSLDASSSKEPHHKKSAHGIFVHTQVVPLTLKLQKEIRGRKYKEVQDVVQQAVDALKEFETEDWPPKSKQPHESAGDSATLATVNETISQDDESSPAESDGAITSAGESRTATPTTESLSDIKAKSQDPETSPTSPSKSENSAPVNISSPAPATTTTTTTTLGEDDPQTREPVHPAIQLTLEAYIAVLSHPAKASKACEYAMDGVQLLVANRYVSGRAGGLDDTSGSGARWSSPISTEKGQSPQRPPPASLLHRVLESVAKCCESNIETTQMAVIRTMKTILTSPKCGVHESSMLLAFRSTFHVYLVTKSPALKNSAKSALLDMLRSVMSRMEAYEAVLSRRQTLDPPQEAQADVSTPGSPSMVEREQEPNFGTTFASQYHADSYALFRSLCKMSSKEVDAENENETPVGTFFNIQAQSDPMSLNGKILALELILSAMDYSGKAFCEGERFIYLVQHYLCVSLLKNCVSNHTQVAFLSQKIFMVLLYKFKGHLKQEIEVFMSNVFLRVLESSNSSFKQKALVLESLRSLCQDPILLTQLFLNYDCDFEARNLYKEIVHILTKLGGKATSNPALTAKKDMEQEFELSLAGLEVLTKILRAFLKALGLPFDQDDETSDTAGARIRGMLQLDVGLAMRMDAPVSSGADSIVSDDSSLVSTSRHGSNGEATEGASASSNAEVAGKIVDAYEQKRNAEQNFEIGAVKFTLSLKNGLNFFISNGFVELDAQSIARFFLSHKDKLDKTQMGEALGREPDAAFVKGDGVDPEKGGPGFWFRILHHYVDALDFTNLPFDEAIRLFLSGFRLPGEAQKIDRIMEKFAERFTGQNPNVFPSADTAFILAFSVIMLNTDLHNPSIKPERRMTVESFIRNNRGIGANGGDLQDEFLIAIFNNIKERPFSLKEDDVARERVGAHKPLFEAPALFENSSLFGDNAEERRRERFKKERDEMMAVTQQLVRRRTDKKSLASSSSGLADNVAPADVVKPMFDVTWGPMLGILSQVLECSDDPRSVAVCLNGFVYAVRLSAHSEMTLARDTFVSSLAKFTYLGSIKEMKEKNLACIRTLLSIAVIDGEHLGESWGPVLQCISQIARLRLTASGLDTDDSFLLVEREKPKKATPPSSRVDLFRVQPSKSEIAREAEENNAQAVLEAVQEVLIDKVFSSTVQLSAPSLAHFIEQLIIVSSSEIRGNSKSGITGVDSTSPKDSVDIGSTTHSIGGGSDGPSIFSLQRLVEVADYNMDVRPRLVWAQIWGKMSDYFAKIACDKNSRVNFFAIDSLKQLSSKFLEKPELSEFNFQRTFLAPFLVVMEDEGSKLEIREMVLQCIDHIVQTKSRNLRSGWITIFQILRRSAVDVDEKIETLGLSILQRLLDDHLPELCNLSDNVEEPENTVEMSSIEKRQRNANVDDFIGLCRASLSFVRQIESDSPRPIGLSMRAFSHTAIYADLLADRRVLPPVSGAQSTDPTASGYTYSGLSESEALEMALWRPLLEGLAEGVQSSSKSSAGGVGCLLQRSSILAFRAILIRHGHLFSTSQWAAILSQTLIPAIQLGAERDQSAVLKITSESPTVSNIDFLVDSLPIPPDSDDSSLLAFKKLQPSEKRCMGEAELMLEASFCDLRHGGDGDPSKAYALAKKDSSGAESYQPFPDSWIATTAPIALGLLTDIANVIVLRCGSEGREQLWPLIAGQYRTWAAGIPDKAVRNPWRPCEALIRIACREARRFPMTLATMLGSLSADEAENWSSDVFSFFSDLMSETTQRERSTHRELLRAKKQALIDRKGIESDSESLDDDEHDFVLTPYGKGKVREKRKTRTRDPRSSTEFRVTTRVIQLEFGGTLYQPAVQPLSPRSSHDARIPAEVSVPGAYWEVAIPELKRRCVAAHCLHQSLSHEMLDSFLPYAAQSDASQLLAALQDSCAAASSAVMDEDLATAFQEALFSDWGDGVAAVEEALENAARLSHRHGSGIFFFTQQASATNATMRLLSILYRGLEQNITQWDRPGFSEGPLFATMVDVAQKFVESDSQDGHLIDPHVWRNASESGCKVALYCTSFASVVLEILKVHRSLTAAQFKKHKEALFPMLCALIGVQSDEVRLLVKDVLLHQVSPLIGLQTAT